MNSRETGFMPHLVDARRSSVLAKNNKKRSQTLLPHTVLTFGSPHNESTCIPFDALIEGSRTGEERVKAIGGVGGRQQGKEQEENEHHKKHQQINLELQQTLEKLRQKTRGELKLRRKLAVTQLMLEEELRRRDLLVNDLFDVVQIRWTFWQRQSAHFQRLLQQIGLERDAALHALDEEGERLVLLEKEKLECNLISAENNTLRQQLKGLQEEMQELEKTCEELRKGGEASEETYMDARHKLQTELMRTQAELQKTARELTEAQDALTATDAMVQQVRLFVQMVCQPNFSVVKDSSLLPVDKNRPRPTGFVLVPLTILLQGYTLLPLSDRRNLIDSYEGHLT